MMGWADIGAVLAYLLATMVFGVQLLRVLRLRDGLLAEPAVAFLAGQLGWLILFLMLSFGGIRADNVVAALGGIFVLACLIKFAIGGWRVFLQQKNVSALLLAGPLLVLLFPRAVCMLLQAPLTGWDARSIWFFHGKAIWGNGGITAEFFANQSYAWSHLDYPLLLPVQSAVIGFLRGAWSEPAVKGFLFVNFVVWFRLLLVVLRRRGWRAPLAIGFAVAVMYISQAGYLNGYADNHYAMPLMLAALLLFNGRREDLGGGLLLALFALNVKNEAAVYVAVGGVIWWGWHRRQGISESVSFRALIGVWALGVVPFVLWALFKFSYGIAGDLHLSANLSHPLESGGRALGHLAQICITLAATYFDSRLLVIPVLAIVIALVHRRLLGQGGLWNPQEKMLGLLFFVVNTMIVAVYALTPYDVSWHMDSSIDRLVVLPALVAVALLVCALEKFWPDEVP